MVIYSYRKQSRPAFIEPAVVPLGVPLGVPPPNDGVGVPPGVPPPNDGGSYARLVWGGGRSGGGRSGGGRSGGGRRSSFPIKSDAGYIGYLSDDDGISGSGHEGMLLSVVRRRRRELLGIDGDISFSACCLLVVFVLMTALVVVWWGFRIASSGVGGV